MATRAESTARVKQWKRSGLSAAELGRREGRKAKQLHWWVWKLGATALAPQPEEPRFMPVRAVSSPAAARSRPEVLVMTSPSGALAVTAIEKTLPNGRLVRSAADVRPFPE